MDIALRTAQMSFARRYKVGTVLVKDNHIVAIGWNGTPSSANNNCEHECSDGSLTTNDNVVHAEMNAVCHCAKNGISTNGAVMYITLSPCVACAIAMIQAGVKEVFYHKEYTDLRGLQLLKEANISVFRYNKDI